LNYTVERHVIADLVEDRKLVADTILASLLVSHGIRVDTYLWLVSGNTVYVLSGSELKHLYPQEKSILGFVESAVFKKKPMPGVAIYPKTVLDRELESGFICIKPCYTVLDYSPGYWYTVYSSITIQPRWKVVIVASRSLEYLNTPLCYQNLVIREEFQPLFIAKSHYIVDIACGAWVRRYGRIEYYDPVAGRGFRESSSHSQEVPSVRPLFR